MFIYEVNLRVQSPIQEEFQQWLKIHVEEILQLNLFHEARIYEEKFLEKKDPEETPYTVTFICHYLTDREEKIQEYLSHHSQVMREKGLARFGNQFSAERRFLELWN